MDLDFVLSLVYFDFNGSADGHLDEHVDGLLFCGFDGLGDGG